MIYSAICFISDQKAYKWILLKTLNTHAALHFSIMLDIISERKQHTPASSLRKKEKWRRVQLVQHKTEEYETSSGHETQPNHFTFNATQTASVCMSNYVWVTSLSVFLSYRLRANEERNISSGFKLQRVICQRVWMDILYSCNINVSLQSLVFIC